MSNAWPEFMSYRYLDDLSYADAAFEVEGGNVEEVFKGAADALVRLMVEDPKSIQPKIRRFVHLKSRTEPTHQEVANLLYDFLEKFIYWKDVDQLLLRACRLELKYAPSGKWVELIADLAGDHIDPEKQALGTDVKAVTFHRLRVWKEGRRWKAIVVVDT